MNPRKSSTFLSLFLKQQSIKVVKPSSVSPLLVKKKPYVLFSSKCGVRCRLYFYVTLWSIDRILSRIAKNWIDVQSKQFLFKSSENIPLRPFTRKAIQKTLKNPNVNRKISRKIARKLLKLNECLTKSWACCLAGLSNEKISHNSIIGNEKKSKRDNGLVPIQPQ